MIINPSTLALGLKPYCYKYNNNVPVRQDGPLAFAAVSLDPSIITHALIIFVCLLSVVPQVPLETGRLWSA